MCHICPRFDFCILSDFVEYHTKKIHVHHFDAEAGGLNLHYEKDVSRHETLEKILDCTLQVWHLETMIKIQSCISYQYEWYIRQF